MDGYTEISVEQALALSGILMNNVDWSNIRRSRVQEIIDNPKKSGEYFTRLIQNGGRLPNAAIYIDPEESFAFKDHLFIQDYKIYDEDRRSRSITSLTLEDIKLMSFLNRDEEWIEAAESVARARASKTHIPLSASAGIALYRYRDIFPLSWRSKTFYFDGTTIELKGAPDRQYVLCMYYRQPHQHEPVPGWHLQTSDLRPGRYRRIKADHLIPMIKVPK